jgi:choline dehydrogenase-like flavoprotein
MFVDARSLPNRTIIESEVCIVGAGAAGITIARELIDAGFRVALLESGSLTFEPDTQALYAGTDIGHSYLDLATCRLRYFGGTTNHWGGWCLPLDEVDFESRPGMPYSGWPFDRNYLDAWYRRAQPVCQLGQYNYDPFSWGIEKDKVADPFRGPHFVIKMLQQSPPTRFGTTYEAELRQAARVTVYLNANALYFAMNDTGTEVSHLPVRTLSGVELEFRSKFYVLAAGGIENARILLLSGRSMGEGLGDSRTSTGRYFMTHLVYSGGVVALSDPYADFSFITGRDGAYYKVDGVDRKFDSFVGVSEDTMRAQSLTSTRIMWMYNFAPVIRAVEALKRLVARKDQSEQAWQDTALVFRDLDGLAEFAARKAMFHEGVPVDGLSLFGCTSEHMPNPDSRILLGTELDPLGLPRVAVDWQVTEANKRKVFATYRLLGAELGRVAFGRLRSPLTDDNLPWPDDMFGDAHNIGTTRMHRDPTQGVVDENCRVHGVANLHVAGSSVFPTCGSSNPTLTIVALAIRLADHLKQRLK